MQRGIKAVKEQISSYRDADKMSVVPYSTLQDRLRERFQPKKLTLTRTTIFLPKYYCLVDYVIHHSRYYPTGRNILHFPYFKKNAL